MKSPKFTGAYFGGFLLFFIIACPAYNQPAAAFQNGAADNRNSNALNTTNIKRDINKQNVLVDKSNAKVIVSVARNSKFFDCSNPNKYSFVVVENPKRKNEADPVIPKDLNITVGKESAAKIELPVADSEAKNFSLSSVEKNKAGFDVNVEWGGGLYHYKIQFNFRCKKNNFYLYKVKNESFSTTKSDSGNYRDKKETKVTKIEPDLPIGKFKMTDYLQ